MKRPAAFKKKPAACLASLSRVRFHRSKKAMKATRTAKKQQMRNIRHRGLKAAESGLTYTPKTHKKLAESVQAAVNMAKQASSSARKADEAAGEAKVEAREAKEESTFEKVVAAKEQSNGISFKSE